MYQRRIVLGGAVSAAFLAAGILTAGTGLAATLSGPPAAVVPALSQLTAMQTMAQGAIVTAAQAIAPAAAMVPGAATASDLLNTATNIYNSVPGLAAGTNTVSGLGPQSMTLPGVSMGGGTVAGLAQSVTPAQLPGTVSGLSQAGAESVPGAGSLPSLPEAAGSAGALTGAAGLLGGAGVTPQIGR